MKQIDTPQDITGLWAAIPTPWKSDGGLDHDGIRINVGRCARVPMDGVYTTDSDGEFYALELAQFTEMVKTFAQAMSEVNMAAAMGVTWCSTQGIIDRIHACLEHGINCFHIAFPFWMPLAPGDVEQFWDDLAAAAPEARWIHYNTVRAQPVLRGVDYARIRAAHPRQLIGSKMGTMNVLEMAEVISSTPDIAHLAVDYTTVFAMMLGAAGTCSYWANTLPHWTRRCMDYCLAQEWREAIAMQKRLLEWEVRYTQPIRNAGHLHGIVGKARGQLSGFLADSGLTKAPYYPVSQELQAEFAKAFHLFWEGEQ